MTSSNQLPATWEHFNIIMTYHQHRCTIAIRFSQPCFFLMCIFLWFMITVNAIQALRWLIGDKSWNLKWPNGRCLVQFLTVLFLLESRILQNVYVLLFDFWASFYTQDKFSVAILFCYSGFKVKWNAFHTYIHTYIHLFIWSLIQ